MGLKRGLKTVSKKGVHLPPEQTFPVQSGYPRFPGDSGVGAGGLGEKGMGPPGWGMERDFLSRRDDAAAFCRVGQLPEIT